MVCYRESLNNTVIRDRYGRVSPVAGTLHDGLYIDHAVHLAHLGMHVKLDTLLRICIHTRYTEVELGKALHPIELTLLYLLAVDLHILRTAEHLEAYGVCEICYISRQYDLAISELSLLSAHDLSVDDDLSDTIVDAGYLKQLALHISSYEHLWII